MALVVIGSTINHLIDHYLLRKEVFIDEQNISYEEEYDFVEKERIIFLIYENNQPIATARLKISKDISKIERVCVLKENRKIGIGKTLIDFIVNYCTEQGINNIHLGAQTHALHFYESCGFVKYGDLYYDAGIPHYNMKKES